MHIVTGTQILIAIRRVALYANFTFNVVYCFFSGERKVNAWEQRIDACWIICMPIFSVKRNIIDMIILTVIVINMLGSTSAGIGLICKPATYEQA